ncbi:hypothetical protein [Microbacterium aurum]
MSATKNRYQRRAIALRDGGCVIPDARYSWCEIAQAADPPTENGVLLCALHDPLHPH